MATPSYPSSITRVAATDPNDDEYKIEYTERYKTIAQNNYDKHLELGQSLSPEQARVLASHLLQSTELDAVQHKERVLYFGLEVLNVWMEKQGSTILVLYNKLKEMGLDKPLAILENARLGNVSLTIVIDETKNNEKVPHNKENVPGGKPLVNVIRPIIYRVHGLKMTQREKILNLRLVRSADGDQNITWNSPARKFKGVQVDIQLFYTSASDRRHTDPGQKFEGMTRIERNVISWIDEGTLCFGYVESEAAVSAGEDLVQPVQETGKALEQSMEELSLKSDLSLEGHVFRQTKGRRTCIRTAPEVDESSDCPGVRISGDPTTEETSTEEQSSQLSY